MTEIATRPTGSEASTGDDPGLAAWRTFLQAHATLVRLLEAELEADGLVSLSDYDVLVHLAAAPGRRLRMSELAEVVVLSRSGMTRRIDRLEAVGFVRRDECAADRRGAFATLTEAGLTALEETRPRYVRGVAEHFISRLTPHDLELLRTALSKVLAAGDLAAPDGGTCEGRP